MTPEMLDSDYYARGLPSNDQEVLNQMIRKTAHLTRSDQLMEWSIVYRLTGVSPGIISAWLGHEQRRLKQLPTQPEEKKDNGH